MKGARFGIENAARGDSFNMVMTPEESPERDEYAQGEVDPDFN